MFHNSDSEAGAAFFWYENEDDRENPQRFPFCDILMYRYNKSRHVFELRQEKGRLWFPDLYHDVSLHGVIAGANGTYLHKFGDFQMRVAFDAEKVLSREMGKNWWNVGVSPNFNHRTLKELKAKKFLLTPELYLPALPFV